MSRVQRQAIRSTRRRSAFTLIEMMVAVALLLLLMGLASQVFKITMDGTGRLTQISEIDRSLRLLEQQFRKELAGVDATRSIMAIQGNPAPAYWTEADQNRDQDGDPTNGITGRDSSFDPLRENPTLGYDAVDELAPEGSFDARSDDNTFPILPRTDILMFVTMRPEERSFVDPDVKSDGPVMIVYNHASLGTLARTNRVDVRPGSYPGDPGLQSTEDWAGPLSVIPQLQSGGGPDPDDNIQDVARDWHLARRAILLKHSFDPLELPPANGGQSRDRYAHVLSPSDPSDNQYAGLLLQPVGQINPTAELHYLNWILGGEMDVVAPISPYGTLVSGYIFGARGADDQHFDFDLEITNRRLGGPGTLDDPAYLNVRNPGYFRGAVPRWWLERSHLDPEPSAAMSHRLAHYFLPNCASFKVEWTPNDIHLEQAGLPEVLWIDPFKEPGQTRRGNAIYAQAPFNGITGTDLAVEKPLHLDEFEILAQKMSAAPGDSLANNTRLGASAFGGDGSYLYQAHQRLKPRFGLSYNPNWIPEAPEGVQPWQANVYDANPTTLVVEPSYNTHSWYAKNVVGIPNPNGPFAYQPQTVDAPDPAWPKALRITLDVFDDTGRLDRPIRHVFIVPVGGKRAGGLQE